MQLKGPKSTPRSEKGNIITNSNQFDAQLVIALANFFKARAEGQLSQSKHGFKYNISKRASPKLLDQLETCSWNEQQIMYLVNRARYKLDIEEVRQTRLIMGSRCKLQRFIKHEAQTIGMSEKNKTRKKYGLEADEEFENAFNICVYFKFEKKVRGSEKAYLNFHVFTTKPKVERDPKLEKFRLIHYIIVPGGKKIMFETTAKESTDMVFKGPKF